MEEAIKVYESLARPPKKALRTIEAGKLKGKTDINPQWRYKAMTEKFGLVGIGWKYDVQRLWTEPGAGKFPQGARTLPPKSRRVRTSV